MCVPGLGYGLYNVAMVQPVVRSPYWQLLVLDGRAYLSASADELYPLYDIGSREAALRLEQLWRENQLEQLATDRELAVALEQLERMGAVAHPASSAAPLRCGVRWLGTAIPEVLPRIRAQLAAVPVARGLLVEDDLSDAQLSIVVRSNASWSDTLRLYAEAAPAANHLFIDLAYPQSVAVGPFIVPGHTACIACLGARMVRRFGDKSGAGPRANSQRALAAVIAANALSEYLEQGTCIPFLERAVTLDTSTLVSRRERVSRLPGCPVCLAYRMPHSQLGN